MSEYSELVFSLYKTITVQTSRFLLRESTVHTKGPKQHPKDQTHSHTPPGDRVFENVQQSRRL